MHECTICCYITFGLHKSMDILVTRYLITSSTEVAGRAE